MNKTIKVLLIVLGILVVLVFVLEKFQKMETAPPGPVETAPPGPVSKKSTTVTTYPSGSTVDDADGNTYSIVKIGDQYWMGENMRTTKYPDGRSITKGCAGHTGCGGTGSLKWGDDTALYSCPPNTDNNGEDCTAAGGAEKLGMLYQWSAAMNGSTTKGAQGICPSGWHIPTHDEFTILEREVCTSGTCNTDFPFDTTTTGNRGTDEATKLESGGTSGFNGLLAGERNTDGSYSARGAYATIWSSMPPGRDAWVRDLGEFDATVNRNTDSKACGFSVRCLKD